MLKKSIFTVIKTGIRIIDASGKTFELTEVKNDNNIVVQDIGISKPEQIIERPTKVPTLDDILKDFSILNKKKKKVSTTSSSSSKKTASKNDHDTDIGNKSKTKTIEEAKRDLPKNKQIPKKIATPTQKTHQKTNVDDEKQTLNREGGMAPTPNSNKSTKTVAETKETMTQAIEGRKVEWDRNERPFRNGYANRSNWKGSAPPFFPKKYPQHFETRQQPPKHGESILKPWGDFYKSPPPPPTTTTTTTNEKQDEVPYHHRNSYHRPTQPYRRQHTNYNYNYDRPPHPNRHGFDRDTSYQNPSSFYHNKRRMTDNDDEPREGYDFRAKRQRCYPNTTTNDSFRNINRNTYVPNYENSKTNERKENQNSPEFEEIDLGRDSLEREEVVEEKDQKKARDCLEVNNQHKSQNEYDEDDGELRSLSSSEESDNDNY